MDIDDLLEYDYLTDDDDMPRRRPNSSGNGGCLTVLIALVLLAYLLS